MDLKAYVPALATRLEKDAKIRLTRQDYLEKDILLHLLLARIVSDDRVRGKLAFKGGTCLIKVYLHYPRFSVDLDFTWLDQPWNSKPSKEVRDLSRAARHAVRDTVLDATKAMGLKTSEPIWGHNSEKLTIEATYQGLNPGNQLVKFQVNFCDPLFYAPREAKAESLLPGTPPAELVLLDEELTSQYATSIPCLVFDPREIVAEKGRAILTRRVPKGRDILDLFLIERDLGVKLDDHLDDVRKKTEYSVKREGKYDEQLNARDERLAALATMDIEELLLKPIDKAAFEAYRARTIETLARLGDEIAASLKSA